MSGTMTSGLNEPVDGASSIGFGRDLLLEVDFRRGSLRRNLQDALRTAIQDGRLAAGTRLPASRRLASDLGVSRGVVADTYDQLAAECYIEVSPRQAPVVADLAGAAAPRRPVAEEPTPPRYRHDFVATTPDVGLFPRRAWMRALERAVAGATNDALDYGDHRGRPELRAQLAAYLARVRGVRTDPGRIVVTQGFTQALDLLCRVLRQCGLTRLWFESPSLAGVWTTPAAAGLEVGLIGVDGDGLLTEDLPRQRGAAVVVTPAHQFPTGAVLAPARRHALVAWAQRWDGLIVEDDYDAEFRYDRAAIGAVQGLDPDRVVHIGTASKTLAPALRLGWMSLPPDLLEAVRAAKEAADSGSPALEQLAFAALLERGDYDRHVVRARHVYRQRRDRLAAALARQLPTYPVEGAAAGLHVLLRLPGLDDLAIASLAAERGLRVRPLSPLLRGGPGDGGLVLGYGRLALERIEEATGDLAAVISAAGRRRLTSPMPPMTSAVPITSRPSIGSARTAAPRTRPKTGMR